ESPRRVGGRSIAARHALMPWRDGRAQSDLGLSDLCLRRSGAADGDGELETRGETELFEDARQMCLDRLDGDRESGRDVLVARAGGDEAHELAFTRRQLLGAGE